MRSLFFFVCLLVAAPASAQYTTATVAACPNDGRGGVCVVYAGANVKPTEAVDNRYFPRTAAELSASTTQRKTELNGLDTTQKAFAVGAVVPDAATGPIEPSPEDVALTAFQGIVMRWHALSRLEPIGGATAEDVSTAAAALVSEYQKASGAQRARYDQALVIFGRGI